MASNEECDHVIGIYIDYGACELMTVSDHDKDPDDYAVNGMTEEFDSCPRCGEGLDAYGIFD